MNELILQQTPDNTSRMHKIVRIIFFLSAFSWTITPIEDYAEGGGSTPEKIISRVIPLMIVVGYALICPQRKNLLNIIQKHNLPLLWYTMLGVICGLNSGIPLLCVWKGFEIICIIIWLSISCYDEESTKREFFAFTRLVEFLLYATLILAIINPSKGLWQKGTMLPWIRGYLPVLNPNAIGILSTMTFLKLLFTQNNWKPVRMFFIGICILLAQSRTSYAIVALVLLIFVYSAFKAHDRKRIALSMIFAFLGFGLAFGMLDSIMKLVLRGQSVEEISTLSGRTDYWAIASENISLLGGGLATGSRLLIESYADDFKATVNLHNSFLEAGMGAGIIGAVPYLLRIIIKSFKRIISIPFNKDPYDIILASLTVLFIARGMTSIVLAIFSFDMLMLNIILKWCSIRDNHTSKQSLPVPRPKPRHKMNTTTEETARNIQVQGAQNQNEI